MRNVIYVTDNKTET